MVVISELKVGVFGAWRGSSHIRLIMEEERTEPVAMSATAILGWRSCLNHGENLKIPDFRDPDERNAVRDDDPTPFPDENGEGATLPAALPREE